jgi:hypothetical protein
MVHSNSVVAWLQHYLDSFISGLQFIFYKLLQAYCNVYSSYLVGIEKSLRITLSVIAMGLLVLRASREKLNNKVFVCNSAV